jgi:hypothetical protein
MLKCVHLLLPDVPLSFSHVPIWNRAIRPRFSGACLSSAVLGPIAWILRGLDSPLGYELSRFVASVDQSDSPPESLQSSERQKGYHHVHLVHGLPPGGIARAITVSRGSVGVPWWAASPDYVTACHDRGIEVRVFTLDSPRRIASHIARCDTDVVFTNRRHNIIPDGPWSIYHG